jgi:type IV pilus assembly protein PilC
MALFTYKAIDATGKTRIGQTEAINVVDLELRLKRMGLDLVVGAAAKRAFGGMGGRITRMDLINFCFHLEQMTQAGVLLTDGLADLRDSVESPRLREVLSGALESIQGGMSLSQSLAQYPSVFDPVFRALVKAGEDTGRLPDVLKNLAEKLRWEDELAAQTKRVVLYPAIISVIMLGVIFFLMIYLVPQMVGFIKNMGQEIPLYTRVLMTVSDIFVTYWYVIIAVPILAFAGIAYLARTNPRVRYRLDGLLLRIPLIGTTLRKIILARFASVFALMYSSGITIIEAIKSAEETAGNKVMEEGLRQAGAQIADGKTVTAAFQDVGIFPPLVVRMLRVGENTGRLDTALMNVNYFYTREVRENVARMQVLIEPVLILILGGVLLWVIVSVLGPIYDVFTKLKI